MRFCLRRAIDDDLSALWAIRTGAISAGCAAFYGDELAKRWASVPMPAGFETAIRETEFVVADCEGTPVGFGFMSQDDATIEGIFVAPHAHRNGIGLALLQWLEDRARARGLSQLSLNASLNAESFYTAAGYHGLERAIWQHPEGFDLPCVRMEKRLSET